MRHVKALVCAIGQTLLEQSGRIVAQIVLPGTMNRAGQLGPAGVGSVTARLGTRLMFLKKVKDG
jgi:hypothetical protein